MILATMRDINLGTCATIVGTTTACTPLPPSNVEICLCHTASSGHLCFSTLLGGRGALGSGERGTWERIGSFFKSSKDLLHYSMLFFRNVPSIFDLHCLNLTFIEKTRITLHFSTNYWKLFGGATKKCFSEETLFAEVQSNFFYWTTGNA